MVVLHPLRGIGGGPLHTVSQTAFPTPRQRTASSALLLSPARMQILQGFCILAGDLEGKCGGTPHPGKGLPPSALLLSYHGKS